MDYKFSDRVSALQPSVIREIFKFVSQPGIIPFAAGNPAPDAFPAKEVAEILEGIMSKRPVDALQYSITEGYPTLRETMSEYMKQNYNVGRDFDNLIITSGAQQVMDLSAKSLCNEGDTVICEAPSFIGSLNAFRSYNLHLCGIPMEKDGINIDMLENALKKEKNVKMIYVIPNFQNPSGITMSAEKRKAVYCLAKKYGVMIIEDNPYGETRFEGEAIPPIKAMDEDGLVIYAGSMSKVLSPGMRVGYAIAPAPVINKMTVCKQTSDVHSNIMAQMIADEFINKYDFGGHLTRIREIYKRKANLMMVLLDSHLTPDVTYQRVQGGLFIWCKLPENVDMVDFCKKAVHQKVAVVPGNAFLTDEAQECHYFRVNFSTPTDEQIIKGVEILKTVLK